MKLLREQPERLRKRVWWGWAITEKEDRRESVKKGLIRFRQKFGVLPKIVVLGKPDSLGASQMSCWHGILKGDHANSETEEKRKEKTHRGRSRK